MSSIDKKHRVKIIFSTPQHSKEKDVTPTGFIWVMRVAFFSVIVIILVKIFG